MNAGRSCRAGDNLANRPHTRTTIAFSSSVATMSTSVASNLAKILELRKKLVHHRNDLQATAAGLSPEHQERCRQALLIVDQLDQRLMAMSSLALVALPAQGGPAKN